MLILVFPWRSVVILHILIPQDTLLQILLNDLISLNLDQSSEKVRCLVNKMSWKYSPINLPNTFPTGIKKICLLKMLGKTPL